MAPQAVEAAEEGQILRHPQRQVQSRLLGRAVSRRAGPGIRDVKSRPTVVVLENEEQLIASELGGLRTSARFAQTSKPHRVPRC